MTSGDIAEKTGCLWLFPLSLGHHLGIWVCNGSAVACHTQTLQVRDPNGYVIKAVWRPGFSAESEMILELQTASDVSGPSAVRTQTSPDVTPGLWCQTYFECSAGMIPTEFHILQRGNMLKPPTRFPLSLADDQTDGSDLDSLDGQIQHKKLCTFDG